MNKKKAVERRSTCADSAGYLGIHLDDRCVVIDDRYTTSWAAKRYGLAHSAKPINLIKTANHL